MHIVLIVESGKRIKENNTINNTPLRRGFFVHGLTSSFQILHSNHGLTTKKLDQNIFVF